MAPYHILIVIISSVIPENLVLLTKSEQSGPKSAHIRPTIGRDGRSVYDHVITKFSGMCSLPHFLSHGSLLRVFRARELR